MIFIKSIEIVAGAESKSEERTVHRLSVMSSPQKSSAIFTISSETAPRQALPKNDDIIFFLPFGILFE